MSTSGQIPFVYGSCTNRTLNVLAEDLKGKITSMIMRNNEEIDVYKAEKIKGELDMGKPSVSLWMERWFWSSNAKDIGTLYLILALFSGLIGTAFSVLIRLELSGPGVQYIADNQLYNSIITAHNILFIQDI